MFFLKFMSAITGIILGFFLYDFIKSIPKKNKIKKYNQAYLFLKETENKILAIVGELVMYMKFVDNDKNLSPTEKRIEQEDILDVARKLSESMELIRREDYIESIMKLIDKDGFENSFLNFISKETALRIVTIRSKLDSYQKSI